MPRPPRRPRWYFSLRSPYSWFAYRDLREHHPDVLAAAEWVPYWEPDPGLESALAERGVRLPVVEMSKAKALYILSDARRLAAERGLTVTWPVDREPRWEVAHLGYLAAEDEGLGRAYVEAVYRARWEHGLDISSPGTVAKAAAEVGPDPERVAGAADDPQLRARGLEGLVAAYKDDAFGVPFFTAGRERFWGVERVPAWVAAVRRGYLAAPDPAPSNQDLLPAGLDGSHAGGCG